MTSIALPHLHVRHHFASDAARRATAVGLAVAVLLLTVVLLATTSHSEPTPHEPAAPPSSLEVLSASHRG